MFLKLIFVPSRWRKMHAKAPPPFSATKYINTMTKRVLRWSEKGGETERGGTTTFFFHFSASEEEGGGIVFRRWNKKKKQRYIASFFKYTCIYIYILLSRFLPDQQVFYSFYSLFSHDDSSSRVQSKISLTLISKRKSRAFLFFPLSSSLIFFPFYLSMVGSTTISMTFLDRNDSLMSSRES